MLFDIIFPLSLHSLLYILFFLYHIAQLAGAVEYTDCTSAEGQDPPPMSVLDMTLNSLMVRSQ